MNDKNILSFWRDVEIFNLPELDKDVSLLKSGDLLPWFQDLSPINDKNVWRYTLYFGRLKKSDIIQTIEKYSTDEAIKEKIEPDTGYTCVAVLILDEQGHPEEKSYLHASYVHGINCLAEKKPVEDVDNRLKNEQENYELRYSIPQPKSHEEEIQNRKGLRVTWDKLNEEIDYLNTTTNLWNSEEIKVFYIAKEVSKKNEADTSFLNSFFLDDLKFLLKTKETFGDSLSEYLSIAIDKTNRLDIIEEKEHLITSIDPFNLPAGRWPSNVSYGLYTAQLGAVCSTLKDLKIGGGIRGINGPPGTGKTTLLKDIIADVVVQRAESMLKNENLFGKYKKIENESGFSNHFYEVDESVFTNYGIVVSSNNNAAVENITKELPSSKGLDTDLIANGYFAECSKRLIDEPSWGILSAALGNSSNRTNFINNFWNDGRDKNEIGFKELIWSVYKDPESDKTYEMKQKYEEVKSKLSELLSKFKTFQNEASHFHSLLHSHIKNKELVKILPAEIDNLITQLNNELETQNIIKDKIDKLNLSIHQLHESLKLQNTQKPFFFFFQKIFKTNSYQKWNESNQFYLEQLQLISKEKSILRNENEIIDKEITSLNIKINKTQHTLSEVTNNIKTYIVIRNKLLVSYAFEKENLVDDDFYSLTLDKMHLSNPYSSIKLNRLRSEIFTTSLEVHKYAILAHSKYFRNNLETFFSVLSGKTKVEKKIAIQLWDTFFFCVPVVSTTLASVSRLFSAHGKENLGWLLLDEAGQATPQSAAGIIWRSKRCIIVGDPLQIEPVVTIPENLVKHLRLQNKVDDLTWSPLVSSVQMLADRISKLGTYMTQSNSDSKIWTGFPLRTHRRCIDPMFKIANEIAYSNQMVKAIEDSKDVLESSKWLNVEGTGISNKHVVKEELVLLKEKILELRKNNYNDQIFVISPFKSIANACNSLVGNLKNVSCGTIHTFQGKEANIVFLILGSDPVSSGARAWASKTPNMLNVALTRAKKRIYVIGNKSLWGKCDYFKIMTKYL